MKNEISKSVESNVEFFSKQLDYQLAGIRLQQIQLLNNSDLLNLSFSHSAMNNYEKKQSVDRITERMGLIMESNTYISNVGVYVKNINATISVKSGYDKTPNSEYDVVKKCFFDKGYSYVNYYEDRIFLLETFPRTVKPRFSSNQIIVYTELSKNKIKEMLNSLQSNKDSGAILVDENFNTIVSTEFGDAYLKNIVDDYKHINSKEITGTFEIKLSNESYWVLYSRANFLNTTLLSFLPASSVTGVLRGYNLLFIILLVISTAVAIIFSLVINIMIHKPMGKFIAAFGKLKEGDLDVSISRKGDNEFAYLSEAFNDMVRRLKQTIEQNYHQKLELQQSELKQLQSQINPHFLYNCFYNINRMCKSEDYENAIELSQRLGSYYHYVTRSGSDEVTLMQEYAHAIDYMEIQSIRFQSRIKAFAGEIPEGCKGVMVPRIILQPVLENAYEHAFEKSINGGTIYMNICCVNKTVTIVIEDDGCDLSDESIAKLGKVLKEASAAAEKTGIINVCRRLQLKYNENSGLFVSRSRHGGLKVDIVINF